MDRILNSLYRGFTRIFPDCMTLSQAIAFNMFLAFFPMLLLVLGILSSKESFHGAVRELPERLRMILPPGSEDVVVQYFTRKGQHPWKWFLLGLGGTLLAGSQVMAGLIEGFRVIEADQFRQSYWRIQSRALLLLVITIVPSLVVIILTVFGRQARAWLIHQFGLAVLIRALAFIFQVGLVFGLSMIVLVLLYRIGRPGHKGFKNVMPGAAIATVLWWVVDIVFGLYVRKMPYNVVYGGLAAAIGLLLWMYMTAIVVLWGAGYNAEWRESAGAEHFPGGSFLTRPSP
ncbi:MAG TPA: YihY/virulence factor BrkB family protein [Candidatus Binatus sp.]|jgi:membrane protein|nr:YihY/virulence factor BrkB family protein [Candidatus Binatus sp.]